MGATIYARDCETRLGSEIGTGKPKELQGYVDAYYAGDLDQRRFTTDYVFTVAECVISWKAELQDTVALSMTEAEYMAAVETSKEDLWLRGLVERIG